jgi:hypothetical protein
MHFGKQTATQRKCKGVDPQLKLRPYSDGCPGGQTPHHLIPHRCATGKPGYTHGGAPCICVAGRNQHTGSHRGAHRIFDPVERYHYDKNKDFKYKTGRNAAAKSAGGARTPPKKLSKKELECVKAQLDEYYKKKQPDGPGLTENSDLTASGAPGKVNELYSQVAASSGAVPTP